MHPSAIYNRLPYFRVLFSCKIVSSFYFFFVYVTNDFLASLHGRTIVRTGRLTIVRASIAAHTRTRHTAAALAPTDNGPNIYDIYYNYIMLIEVYGIHYANYKTRRASRRPFSMRCDPSFVIATFAATVTAAATLDVVGRVPFRFRNSRLGRSSVRAAVIHLQHITIFFPLEIPFTPLFSPE